MSQTPPTVTGELSDRLLDALGAPGLVELSAYIALANVYTRTNVAPAVRADLEDELNTVASLVIENGRISRIYAVRNPTKLARLGEVVQLSRAI